MGPHKHCGIKSFSIIMTQQFPRVSVIKSPSHPPEHICGCFVLITLNLCYVR